MMTNRARERHAAATRLVQSYHDNTEAHTALDRFFLAEAHRLAASQPRADYTIFELPQLATPATSDLIPVYRNGQTYCASLGSLPSALPGTFGIFDVCNYGPNPAVPGYHVGDGSGKINPATGNTYDYDAIAAALNAATSTNGGVIWFQPGTYVINHSVDFTGFSNLTFAGPPGWQAVIKCTADLNGSVQKTKNGLFSAFNNVRSGYPSNVTFEWLYMDCTLQNGSGIGAGQQGINLCAIELQNVNNARIQNCYFYKAFGNGVCVPSWYPDDIPVTGILIADNVFDTCLTGVLSDYGIAGSGIQIGAASGGEIRDNIFLKTGGPAIDIFFSYATEVTGNYFSGVGAGTWTSGGSKTQNGKINGIHSDAGCRNCIFERNIFEYAGGIFLEGRAFTTFQNRSFPGGAPGPIDNIITHNLFVGTGNYQYSKGVPTSITTGNSWTNDSGFPVIVQCVNNAATVTVAGTATTIVQANPGSLAAVFPPTTAGTGWAQFCVDIGQQVTVTAGSLTSFAAYIAPNAFTPHIQLTAGSDGPTGTLTLAGTITNGDVITTTINGHAVAYTVNTTNDTSLNALANNVANAINTDATAKLQVYATVATGTSVITLTGSGTFSTYYGTVSNGATETYTPSSSTNSVGFGTNLGVGVNYGNRIENNMSIHCPFYAIQCYDMAGSSVAYNYIEDPQDAFANTSQVIALLGTGTALGGSYDNGVHHNSIIDKRSTKVVTTSYIDDPQSGSLGGGGTLAGNRIFFNRFEGGANSIKIKSSAGTNWIKNTSGPGYQVQNLGLGSNPFVSGTPLLNPFSEDVMLVCVPGTGCTLSSYRINRNGDTTETARTVNVTVGGALTLPWRYGDQITLVWSGGTLATFPERMS